MRSRPLLPLLLLPSLLLPVALDAAPRRGHLLLIGGGAKPRPVLQKFVSLAGGPDAPIVVLPTASGDPDTGAYYVELLREEAGATDVTPLELRDPLDARRPSFLRALCEAGGIFFSGGDQSRITRALRGTPALRTIRAALARGAVIGGTSAGTACMSEVMLTGEGDPAVLRTGNIETVPGLGLLPPGVVVDQHFVARQRQGRLLGVVLDDPARIGLGVDEATALWVKPDDTLEVLGEGWVMVYDARHAVVTRRGEQLGVRSMTTHVLLPGDRLDLRTGNAYSSGGRGGG